MKRKLTIQLILGKETKVVYSTLSQLDKVEVLKTIMPAAISEPEPPFSTEMTLRKGDVFSFVEQFNNLTDDCLDDFPIPVVLTLIGGVFSFEIKAPTTLSLINIFFDVEDYEIEEFIPTYDPEFTFFLYNLALLKIDNAEEEDFFETEHFAMLRMMCGSLRSYHSIVRRIKRKFYFKRFLPKKPRKYLSPVPRIKMYKKPAYLNKIQKYIKKSLSSMKKENHNVGVNLGVKKENL